MAAMVGVPVAGRMPTLVAEEEEAIGDERRSRTAGEGGLARGRRARWAVARAGRVARGEGAIRESRTGGKDRKIGSDRLIPCRDTPDTQYGGVTFIYIANMAGYTRNTIKYT